MLMSASFYSLASRSNYLAYPRSSINVLSYYPSPLHPPLRQIFLCPFKGYENPKPLPWSLHRPQMSPSHRGLRMYTHNVKNATTIYQLYNIFIIEKNKYRNKLFTIYITLKQSLFVIYYK